MNEECLKWLKSSHSIRNAFFHSFVRIFTHISLSLFLLSSGFIHLYFFCFKEKDYEAFRIPSSPLKKENSGLECHFTFGIMWAGFFCSDFAGIPIISHVNTFMTQFSSLFSTKMSPITFASISLAKSLLLWCFVAFPFALPKTLLLFWAKTLHRIQFMTVRTTLSKARRSSGSFRLLWLCIQHNTPICTNVFLS